MSADGSSPAITNLLPNGERASLADVLQAVERNPSVAPRRRSEISSALRSLCTWLGADPASVASDPRNLRKRFESITPAGIGVSAGRFANVRHLVLKGLRLAGIRSMPGRARDPLSPEWEVLRARLPDRHAKHALSRLMSHCTSRGIAPDAVDTKVFEEFRVAYEAGSLLRDPAGTFRDACKVWNQAAATITGWPSVQVLVPDRRRTFALPLDAFPTGFQTDLEAYLSQREEPDVFDDGYSEPATPRTIKRKRQNILMAATALVKSGFPVGAITSLGVLVSFDNSRAALKLLLGRANNTVTDYLWQIATELKTVARCHVGASEQELDRLRAMARRLKPKSRAFTEKNRAFLRQFADQEKLAALLLLPRRLLDDARRRKIGPRRQAVLAELAIAIAIELSIPIRVDDLTDLRLDRHLHFIGRSGKVALAVPAGETKNGVAIEALLPPRVVELLNTYLAEFRPRLLKAPSPWLFPGEDGERRSTGGFSQQIAACVWREIGVELTTHQFRHLSAKLFLDRRRGDFGTVQHLLGHKSRATTERFYCELDRVVAVQHYGALVTELLAEFEAANQPTPTRRIRAR